MRIRAKGRVRLAAMGCFAAAALSVGLATTVSQSASAAFPGANGKIVFATNRGVPSLGEVYVMNADGSGQTNLSNNSASPDGEPEWSSDGSKIAYSSLRVGDAAPEVYVMNADGSGQTNLTHNAARDEYPAWSPDGSKIAFTSDRGGSNGVYVMNANGSGQTSLGASGYAPAWSPDGSKIAFTSTRRGPFEVWVMNADGSGQRSLANGYGPDWSPDGSKIAFASSRSGNFEVYVMNADGSGQTNVSNNGAVDHWPAWSPDGAKIAFARIVQDIGEVFVMNADGSGQTNLTKHASYDQAPDWQPLPAADLALSLTASSVSTRGRRQVTYTATVKNAGPTRADDVVLSAAIPSGTRLVSISTGRGRCPTRRPSRFVRCALGSLAPSASTTATVKVIVVARARAITNRASVRSSTPDPNMANNAASITTRAT